MRKTLEYIFFALLTYAMSACVPELPYGPQSGDELPYPEEGKALVNLSVVVPGQVMPGTKAMAETPDISGFTVVVFGSSGFLKESVDVNPGDFEAAITNGDETTYKLHVHLSLSDSKNLRINVIANCNKNLPWKNEDVVLNQSAYTEGNQDAYWSRFILPDGLTLKKEYDSEANEMKYVKDGEYYCVTDDVTAAFTNIPMLRNFAKVSVESTTPQLVLDPTATMAVINRPDRGSVAPYDTKTGSFLDGYRDSTYAQLRATYDGFAPKSMQLVDTNPDEVTFLPCGKDASGKITGGQYIFERPKPGAGDTPTYLIIHGTYYPFKSSAVDSKPTNWKELENANPGTYLDLANGQSCYYKIDFTDDEGYYAVLRNFRYHIRITNVAKVGADTPGQAGSTGGSGDISSSTEASGLTDISDGYGRIAVSYVEMTLVQSQPVVELKYKFIPNADDGDNGTNNKLVSEGGPVTITIGEKSGPINVLSSTFDSAVAAGTEIGDSNVGKIRVLNTLEDDEHFRTIQFTCNAPSTENRTSQTIRISGAIDETKNIYRDVTYYLMEKQTMTVQCVADEPNPDYGEDYVEKVMGEGVNVNITIPILLPESMFPLVFNIESDALSITPNTTKYTAENLPVESGYSICTGNESKKTFHYVKTLSYAEYQSLEDNNGKTITCHFKTNKAASASTIYVDNKYFNRGSDQFYNYTMYNFQNLAFSLKSAPASTNVNFTFSLDDEDSTPRTVTVVLDGLVPRDGSGLTEIDAEDGSYFYTATSRNVSLPLRTISAAAGFDRNYSVSLSAYDSDGRAIYNEAELYSTPFTPSSFTNLTFGNAFYGNGWPVSFSFTIPNTYEMPAGGIDIELGLTNLVPNDSNISESGGKYYYHVATTGNKTLSFKTSGSRTEAVGVSLSNADFNDASATKARTYLNIAAGRITNSVPGASYPFYYYSNTVNIYTNKNSTGQVASYTTNTGYNTSATNSSAADFASNIIDASTTLYLSLYSRYNGNTYYATTTAEALYNNGNAVTVEYSTTPPGHHYATIDITSGNGINYNGGTASDNGASVTFSADAVYAVGNDYLRLNYGTQSFTITAAGAITSISFNVTGNNYRSTSQSASTGTISRNDNAYTWTDSSSASPSEVTISLTKASQTNDRRIRIASITVEYVDPD